MLKRVKTSYAVTWQEGAGPVQHGKLELRPGGLVLEGADGSGPKTQQIAYGHVTSVRAAHTAGERLSGRQTLVIDRESGVSLRIAGVSQPGFVSEIAESLTVLRAAAP
jgi:hypothetical protein